jgi:ATP-binding cassette subfamily B protein
MAKTVLQEEEFTGGIRLGPWLGILRQGRCCWKYIFALMVVAVVTAAADSGITLVTKYVIDDLRAEGGQANLWNYGLIYGGLIGAFCLCIWTFITLAGKISTGISHELRREGFARLQELSFSYYDRRNVGWLVTRLTSDCDRLSRTIAWGSLDVVWSLCMMAVISAVLLVLDWQLGLMVLSVVPPLMVISYWFQKRMLRINRRIRKANSNITAAYNESIMGVRTTKSLVREEDNLAEFEELTGGMYGDSVRNAILGSLYMPLMLTITSIGAGIALWQGGLNVMRSGPDAMTLGTLFAFISFAGHFFFPVQELSRFLADFQAAQAAAERVAGLLETVPEIQDSDEVRAAIAACADDESRPASVAFDGGPDRIETIEFDHVSFAYEKGQRVLDDFNLRVEGGQTIALVGPTGGGKSTIVSLLCRFYEPTEGRIRINGTDYRQRSLLWLQGKLGIVLQSPHLFSGTIRDNIRYGRLDATDEEVIAAAEMVNAHEFIREMDDGYDTTVGEGGVRLSTGQKQLVSFARAILADPELFVMDEATSSVDTETEQKIQAALDEMMSGRISFVIAHRLSTIRKADVILVIDGGKIVEQGTHHDLIAAGGRYYQLYTNQFTREHEDELFVASD